MAYGSVPLEKRLRENIKNYRLENLYDLEKIQKSFRNLHTALGVEAVLDDLAALFSSLGEKQYRFRETAIYADELEEALEKDRYQAKHGEHVDTLTGLLGRTYFDARLTRLKETGTAPNALICVNINDWKFVNGHFGDEESDRLIRIVADILKKEAKPEYLIGRVDGDVFYIVIEAPEEGEARDYCSRIKEACQVYEDAVLAPSVAIGMVTRLSVEEDFYQCFSEAEYEMFRDKFDEKNSPGYRERLEKALTK